MANEPATTVPMYAPDGTLGDVPYDQMHAALQAGAKLGVNVTAPDGTHGVIPAEHLQDAVKAGGKVVPWDLSGAPSHNEAHKGTWDTFVDDIKSVFSSAVSGKPYAVDEHGNLKSAWAEQSDQMRVNTASRKASGASIPYRVGASIAESSGTNVTGMEEAAHTGNSDAVLGHMLAGQALAASPVAADAVGKVSGTVLSKLPSVSELKPTIVSELEKTHSVTGRIAKVAAEKLLPDKPVYPGAPLPSLEEFYDITGGARAKGYLREMRAAAQEGKAVPVAKNPNPGGYTGPPKPTKPTAPQIVSPETGATEPSISEGRPATWTNERVIQLASQGDRNAIAQAVRRGFMLPENARYVMGDVDYPRGVSSPKSVTKFTPEGKPITQGEQMELDTAYRVRDVGEEGIKPGQSHAHATTNLEEAQSYVPGREDVQGNPQEIVKFDLTKLKEGTDYVRVPRPGRPDWIRVLRPLPESAIVRHPLQ